MKDPLNKIFVNCNKIKEGEARRVLQSRKELSIKKWDWDTPLDLQRLNKLMINDFRSETMIGLGRWKNTKKLFICMSNEGNLIYLTPEIIKIMYNSIKSDAVHAISDEKLCPCGHIHEPSSNGKGLRTYCVEGSNCNSDKCKEFVSVATDEGDKDVY